MSYMKRMLQDMQEDGISEDEWISLRNEEDRKAFLEDEMYQEEYNMYIDNLNRQVPQKQEE